MEASGALFDEAHLQSLASSLGKKQNVNGVDAYVKDPQCHGAFSSFSNRELSRRLVEISGLERRVFASDPRRAPLESRVSPDSPARAFVSPPSRRPTETLQDLLRFLRRDASKDRPVACALHAWNVLEKDALPLILTYHTAEHEALSLDAIKLLVFLTLPPDGDAANVIDQKRKARHALEAMFRFRDVRGDVFAVLFSRLAGPLERHENSALRAREEDGKLVQLFVTLVRNLLLASQSPAGETRGEANAAAGARRLRASTVKMLSELRVLRCLAQMARDARKKPFSEDAALLVETFHLLFASQSPSRLAKALRRDESVSDDAAGAGAEEDDAPRKPPRGEDAAAKPNGADPLPGLDDPPVRERAPRARTFVDACRVKSTQMRHGRFGGATARLLAKAATESRKRKSFIGSELRDAPGGYFGERPTGGPARRGAKARGANGAIMTSDTVGAFKASLDVDFGGGGGDVADDSDPALREALAEFALDLSKGGFNEIALAAWNQLRHQEQHATGTEEHAARVHAFLGLAHFFVVFSRLRLARAAETGPPNDAGPEDGDGSTEDAPSRRSSADGFVASASNLFDKHVAHWLRMTWDFFEETRDRRGLVLVSGLMNEMLGFLEAVLDVGSRTDVFACEALIAETCGDAGGGDDPLPRFFASRVRRYETADAPLVFLANVAEAMHASGDLARRANPEGTARPKTYFDAKTVENHVRLAAHWRLNKPRLNAFVARFFAEAVDAEMELAFHTFASLQTLHAVATETADETRRDLKMLRRISAKLVADFVGGLYQQEREDGTAPKIPRAKYVDLVF